MGPAPGPHTPAGAVVATGTTKAAPTALVAVVVPLVLTAEAVEVVDGHWGRLADRSVTAMSQKVGADYFVSSWQSVALADFDPKKFEPLQIYVLTSSTNERADTSAGGLITSQHQRPVMSPSHSQHLISSVRAGLCPTHHQGFHALTDSVILQR